MAETKAPDMNGKEKSQGTFGVFSRRSLLSVGWIASLVSMAGPVFANVRYLFPNVLYERPTSFKLKRPAEYAPDSITFEEEHRLFVFRERHGFRAVSAICTHLRCTIRPFGPPTDRFNAVHSRCPCHGSVFDKYGQVMKGPASRPLDCFRLTLSPAKRLLVNTQDVVSPDIYFKA